MRLLTVLTAIAAFLGIPYAAHAPVGQRLPRRSTLAQPVQNAEITAELLRSVGDHIARLAFVSDPGVRRRNAALLARAFHAIAADTTDQSTSNVIRRLATALAHYDLPEIAAASEQRRIMELKFQQRLPAESHAGANVS